MLIDTVIYNLVFGLRLETHVNILFNAASNTDGMIQYTTVKFEYDTGNRKRMTLFLLMAFFNEN